MVCAPADNAAKARRVAIAIFFMVMSFLIKRCIGVRTYRRPPPPLLREEPPPEYPPQLEELPEQPPE